MNDLFEFVIWSDFVRNIFLMQAITAGALSAVSDIVAQKLSGIQKLQLKRILLKVV
jgi:hypothetical protein